MTFLWCFQCQLCHKQSNLREQAANWTAKPSCKPKKTPCTALVPSHVTMESTNDQFTYSAPEGMALQNASSGCKLCHSWQRYARKDFSIAVKRIYPGKDSRELFVRFLHSAAFCKNWPIMSQATRYAAESTQKWPCRGVQSRNIATARWQCKMMSSNVTV